MPELILFCILVNILLVLSSLVLSSQLWMPLMIIGGSAYKQKWISRHHQRWYKKHLVNCVARLTQHTREVKRKSDVSCESVQSVFKGNYWRQQESVNQKRQLPLNDDERKEEKRMWLILFCLLNCRSSISQGCSLSWQKWDINLSQGNDSPKPKQKNHLMRGRQRVHWHCSQHCSQTPLQLQQQESVIQKRWLPLNDNGRKEE